MLPERHAETREVPDYPVFCWFHLFWHPFDGVSDGWMCHGWGPKGMVTSTQSDGLGEA